MRNAADLRNLPIASDERTRRRARSIDDGGAVPASVRETTVLQYPRLAVGSPSGRRPRQGAADFRAKGPKHCKQRENSDYRPRHRGTDRESSVKRSGATKLATAHENWMAARYRPPATPGSPQRVFSRACATMRLRRSGNREDRRCPNVRSCGPWARGKRFFGMYLPSHVDRTLGWGASEVSFKVTLNVVRTNAAPFLIPSPPRPFSTT